MWHQREFYVGGRLQPGETHACRDVRKNDLHVNFSVSKAFRMDNKHFHLTSNTTSWTCWHKTKNRAYRENAVDLLVCETRRVLIGALAELKALVNEVARWLFRIVRFDSFFK